MTFLKFSFREKISEEMVPHQHVFCEPALSAGQAGGYSEGETLLAEQGVAAVARAVGHDTVVSREVGDEYTVRVTRPVVHDRT